MLPRKKVCIFSWMLLILNKMLRVSGELPYRRITWYANWKPLYILLCIFSTSKWKKHLKTFDNECRHLLTAYVVDFRKRANASAICVCKLSWLYYRFITYIANLHPCLKPLLYETAMGIFNKKAHNLKKIQLYLLVFKLT